MMRRIWAVAEVVLRGWLRRKEAYVYIVLLAGLQLAVASLGGAAGGGSSLYLFDAGLLLTWFFGWAVALHAGAAELPGEEAHGTVFLLLAKPLSRAELIAGKWLGAWLAVTLCTLAFYAVTLIVAYSAGVAPPLGALIQAGVLHLISLAVLIALSLALSTRLNRDAAVAVAIVAALALYLIVPGIPQLACETHGWRVGSLNVLYYGLPHLELFDLRRRVLHGFGPLPGGVLATLAAYGVVWTGALLMAAWLSYRRRRFQRDRLLE